LKKKKKNHLSSGEKTLEKYTGRERTPRKRSQKQQRKGGPKKKESREREKVEFVPPITSFGPTGAVFFSSWGRKETWGEERGTPGREKNSRCDGKGKPGEENRSKAINQPLAGI